MAKTSLTLSKKQSQLCKDITSKYLPEIYVLGSVQSGKTFDICFSTILYCQKLHEYDSEKQYNGAIVGWSIETLKGNIVEPLEQILNNMGYKKKVKGKGDYELKYSSDEKFLKLWNIKLYFFGFNNVLAFNKILGKPLVFEWIDESARIYTQKQLQEPFDELPGRQVSFVGHPFKKVIHSFNVEGSENHDYKIKYIDGKPNAKHYTFYPYDNPLIDTPEKIREVIETFPEGSLREQKIFNRWVIASGKVFTKLNIMNDIEHLQIREIGIGIDYGSVNPTTFVPIALCFDNEENKWKLVRLQCYYHDSKAMGDTPTTEYFSIQLRMFLKYLRKQYPNIPITTIVIDSEASHFANRLDVDNIPYINAKKGAGSVNEGVEGLQSLIYKKYFYIYEQNSIKHFYNNGTIEFTGKDDSKIEYESYQYDTPASVKTGVNCYKKEYDHSIDASRYIIKYWQDTGRCPIV